MVREVQCTPPYTATPGGLHGKALVPRRSRGWQCVRRWQDRGGNGQLRLGDDVLRSRREGGGTEGKEGGSPVLLGVGKGRNGRPWLINNEIKGIVDEMASLFLGD